MDPLQIVLIVLGVVGIWAVVELALTLRKTRNVVEEVSHSTQETIDQLQPIIAKADGMVDDLQPSMKRVDPLLQKALTSVDLLNTNLTDLDRILGDVSQVSSAASNVSNAAGSLVDHAASAAGGLVNKIAGIKDAVVPDALDTMPEKARLAERTGEKMAANPSANRDAEDGQNPEAQADSAGSEPKIKDPNAGYVTYGSFDAIHSTNDHSTVEEQH